MIGSATPGSGRPAEITTSEIRRRLADPRLALVNVLPRESFIAERIPGSLSLPVPEIPARAREVLRDPSREIAVYCAAPT